MTETISLPPPAELTQMLQMQTEACALLRAKIMEPNDLLAAAKSVSEHHDFFKNMSALAAKLQAPLETVFQCLMHISTGNSNTVADFDRQARQGNVPMHQAKILKREAAVELEPRVTSAVPPNELAILARFSSSLRTLLRMKCEDGNDLGMARRAIEMADDYFGRIMNYSGGNADALWKLFMANNESHLARTIRHALGGGHGEDSATDSADDEVGVQQMLPVPADLASGVEALCRKSLLQSTAPVPERQYALQNIEAWFKNVGSSWNQEVIKTICAGSFRRAMVVHLGEKRSALCRSACDIVSGLLQNTTPALCAVPELRDALVAWLEVLVKQVHVTVATISNATDSMVRDLFVASGGAIQLMNMCSQVAQQATQPELQRKALGYLCLGLVSHLYSSGNDPAAKSSLLASADAKLLKSSNENVRRVARVAAILCHRVSPMIPFIGWDERAEKAAAADAGVVFQSACSGPADFEKASLRYQDACPVSKTRPPGAPMLFEMPPVQMLSPAALSMSTGSAATGMSTVSPLGLSVGSTASTTSSTRSTQSASKAVLGSSNRVPLSQRANATGGRSAFSSSTTSSSNKPASLHINHLATTSSGASSGGNAIRSRDPASPGTNAFVRTSAPMNSASNGSTSTNQQQHHNQFAFNSAHVGSNSSMGSFSSSSSSVLSNNNHLRATTNTAPPPSGGFAAGGTAGTRLSDSLRRKVT